MANLVINVRCTCEEEFLLLHKLHKLYQEDQLRKRLAKRQDKLTLEDVLEAQALERAEALDEKGQCA